MKLKHNTKLQIILHTGWQHVGVFFFFFFFSVLWFAWSGNHPSKGLARFGYILDMKVLKKKPRIFLYFWLRTKTYHKKSGDLEFNFSSFKIWWSWVLFFLVPLNPLCRSKSYFSAQNLVKFHPQKTLLPIFFSYSCFKVVFNACGSSKFGDKENDVFFFFFFFKIFI